MSYGVSTEATTKWKAHQEYAITQETGKHLWYQHYELVLPNLSGRMPRRLSLSGCFGVMQHFPASSVLPLIVLRTYQFIRRDTVMMLSRFGFVLDALINKVRLAAMCPWRVIE